MQIKILASVVALLATSVFVGCGSKPDSVSSSPGERAVADQATIAKSLAELSADDRILAESQKYCAIATENPLGTMGTPIKIEVNGHTVFLCCSGCKGKALGNPEETLASVAKLKAENTANQ